MKNWCKEWGVVVLIVLLTLVVNVWGCYDWHLDHKHMMATGKVFYFTYIGVMFILMEVILLVFAGMVGMICYLDEF